MKLKDVLCEFYLDYFNNFLTIEKFSQHYGLTWKQASQLIQISKDIYEMRYESDDVSI